MNRLWFGRTLATLFAVMFLGATVLRVMPTNAALVENHLMAMTPDVQGTADPQTPMPCKGMTPSCMSDLGCVYLVGMIAPGGGVFGNLGWVELRYTNPLASTAPGRTRSPDLRPPIFLS